VNGGRKVAILVGQGALNAREEVTQVADLLGAPVSKALLGKAVLADDSPFTTGGIGHLGTAPSSWAMKNCDAVFIIGSTMPWFEYYPKPGQAPRPLEPEQGWGRVAARVRSSRALPLGRGR
jgi:pyruvate dehydrogenase (quinone)